MKTSKLLSYNCKQCSKEFKRRKPSQDRVPSFCSKHCTDENFRLRDSFEAKCLQCLKVYREWNCRKGRKHFCSQECKFSFSINSNAPSFEKGVSTRDNGAISFLVPSSNGVGSAKYIQEHRLVASNIIGRNLESFEKILHINNVHEDNNPLNLFICGTNSEMRRRITGSLPWPEKSNLDTYK